MRTIVGMFETRPEAESAIHRLKASGVGTDLISIAMRDTREASDLVEATGANDMSAEGATAGVVSGAAVGTLIGLALVGSTFVLPGVGTFLIGGPLAAALTGAGIGAASGIEQGHILVSADVGDDQAQTVTRIFDEEGSRRTHTA